jgi:hypothetical protein
MAHDPLNIRKNLHQERTYVQHARKGSWADTIEVSSDNNVNSCSSAGPETSTVIKGEPSDDPSLVSIFQGSSKRKRQPTTGSESFSDSKPSSSPQSPGSAESHIVSMIVMMVLCLYGHWTSTSLT